jgi:signal transduction histidine kinase
MTTSDDRTADVVSTLSHELRSPLVSLRGFTRVLLERWDRLTDDDRRELLSQIDVDAARIARLVDELLDVSRIESGRFFLRHEPVVLDELIDGVLHRVAMAHPEMRCRVVVEPHVPTVRADGDKVAQIITNLVENGVKYATPDQLSIHVSTSAATPDSIEVRVDDRGPGLSTTDHERVFARFARAGGGRPTGLGIGLWISRAIAEAHGGSLVAEANGAGGTSFRLTLPVGSPTD